MIAKKQTFYADYMITYIYAGPSRKFYRSWRRECLGGDKSFSNIDWIGDSSYEKFWGLPSIKPVWKPF